MNTGDLLTLTIHDTPEGFGCEVTTCDPPDRVDDRERGERVQADRASADSTTCNEPPYSFHPVFDVEPATRSTWAAHTLQRRASDELGHFA